MSEQAASVDSPAENRVREAIVAIARKPAEKPGPPGQIEQSIYEFDEAYTAYVEAFVALPKENQLLAIQALDTQVASMVSRRDASLWTPAGHRSDPDWQELRLRAVRVLRAFEWEFREESG